jgi:hypothetical protein
MMRRQKPLRRYAAVKRNVGKLEKMKLQHW